MSREPTEITVKRLDPHVEGKAMFDWIIATQPHHTSPPDIEKIERDGYVERRRLMTIDELKRLYPVPEPCTTSR